MKEGKFNHLIKSKLDKLNVAPEVIFDEEVLWKRIEPKIKGGSGNNWYPSIGLLILVAIGFFYYFDNAVPNHIRKPVERVAVPMQVDTIRSIVKQTDSTEIEKIETSILKHKTIKKEKPISRSVFNDTIKVATKLKPAIVKSKTRLKTKQGSENDNSTTYFKYVEKEFARVHVYRQKKIIGFGWVFNLKANGKTITKVKNGGYEVLELKPGKTQFSIKQKTVDINLEAGKTYYLRASIINGLPIGKPHLEEVSKAYVKEEFFNN